MKKQIIFILSCIVILSIATGCGSKSKTENPADNKASTTKIKSDPPKKKYVQLAEKTNASMPMLIPGNVRMDRAEAVSAKEYKYYYTFTQEPVVSAEEFIRSSKPALSIGMREQKGVDLDMFRQDKMTVIYAYYKLDGTLFAEIKITPNEYTE